MTAWNARLCLADGNCIPAQGFGAYGIKAGEVCFNTAMTGYQEILTDPSYAEQIICFTFPHIGITGTNPDDHESGNPVARGAITRSYPTAPSSWRATDSLSDWLKAHGVIGLAGVDTRELTRLIRTAGAPDAVICHLPDEGPDDNAIESALAAFPGLAGRELAARVSGRLDQSWQGARWVWPAGHAKGRTSDFRVAVVDYGTKFNIMRCMTELGAEVLVFPATASAGDILSCNPDGLLLSNGPGDPAATAVYAVPTIRKILDESRIPVFGICLGHQLLALALGARTVKMNHGHHGANHPVQDLASGKVEITSMNHGFAVDRESLPCGVVETHVSLFDGSNCGIRQSGERSVFSVQFHPEASPGPQDSFYLFRMFREGILHHRKLA